MRADLTTSDSSRSGRPQRAVHRNAARQGARLLARWAIVATLAVVAVPALGLGVGAGVPAGPGLTPAAAGTGVRSYAPVGDSITAGLDPASSAAAPGPTSWLQGETAGRLQRVGGWAKPRATTADMRANVVRAPADVLVLLGGTNDVISQLPWSESEANLLAISATVGARRTLLLAIPPLDQNAAARGEFDRQLQQLAGRQGWTYLDPWTSVAAGDSWLPGSTSDGIHPTPEAAVTVGRVIAGRMWQLAALRAVP